MLAQKATRYWWALLVVGVAWLVIGWGVLRADVTSLSTVGVLLGIVFIASGVNEMADASMVSGGWKFVHYGICWPRGSPSPTRRPASPAVAT
jgi:uncharacterized membrane protein HdeD (DUF308 family)